jgi:hypothetical protein
MHDSKSPKVTGKLEPPSSDSTDQGASVVLEKSHKSKTRSQNQRARSKKLLIGRIRKRFLALSSWGKSLTAIAAISGTIATIATVTTNLATIGHSGDSVWHLVFPEPTPTPSPTADISGAISDIQLGTENISLGDVYRRQSQSPAANRVDQLNTKGLLINFKCTFGGGLSNQSVSIRWTLHEANGHTIPPNGIWETDRAKGWPTSGFLVQGPNDNAEGSIWIPYIAQGRFYVEIELTTQNSVLDLKSTPEFDVSADQINP